MYRNVVTEISPDRIGQAETESVWPRPEIGLADSVWAVSVWAISAWLFRSGDISVTTFLYTNNWLHLFI